MHGNAWARLLGHLPPEFQEQMVVVTASGTEIAVNSILRIDHEFLAFKGRLSGTQDQGRLFFLPFRNIDHIGFQREVKDEQYHEIFGNLDVPAPHQPGAVAVAKAAEPVPEQELMMPHPEQELLLQEPEEAVLPSPEPPAEPEPPPAPAEPPPVAPSANLPQRGPSPLKSAVLERFRSRSGQGTNVRPNGEG